MEETLTSLRDAVPCNGSPVRRGTRHEAIAMVTSWLRSCGSATPTATDRQWMPLTPAGHANGPVFF